MTNEQLVERIQAGETQLMDALLNQNRGIIHRVAFRYKAAAERNRGLDYDDLVQSASLGMMEAVPAWEAGRGMAFVSLAVLFMARSIMRELGMHTTKQRIENMNPALLSTPLDDEGGDTLVDTLADDDAADPGAVACNADLCRIVREEIERLPANQRRAVLGYHLEGCTLASLAAQDGLSLARLSQLRAAGERALRRNVRLIRLWREYESACDVRRSLKTWRYTHTSSTEAAAMRRERLREALGDELYNRLQAAGVR